MKQDQVNNSKGHCFKITIKNIKKVDSKMSKMLSKGSPKNRHKIQPVTVIVSPKGQLISKANCQAVNSSKKRTNEFVFYYYATCFCSFFGRN